jgi:UDP-N-acetylmuramoylalanine--D-glutamate ligase
MLRVEGQRFSVLGLARTGVATSNYLVRHGADVLASDPKTADKLPLDQLDPRVEVRPGTNEVRPGDIVVISPGIRPDSETWAMAHKLGSEVISDIELFYRLCPAPIVAITGTDGKSTTVTLIAAMFEGMGKKVFLGGNIGIPCMEGIESLDSDSVAVLEVSCFQLSHCTTFRPKVALVTNIAEDHVDYYGSMEGYIGAKRRIFASMGKGDVLVLNGEDPVLDTFIPARDVTVRRFGWKKGFDVWCDGDVVWPGGLALARVKLQGLHNAENIMSAILCVEGLVGPTTTYLSALQAFPGLEHRMEYVTKIRGITFLNDSKATNPHAAGAVLNAFREPFVLLAGGSEKSSDFDEFGRLVATKTKAAVLFGATKHRIAGTIPPGHPVHMVDTLEQAIRLGYELASPGDRVILAPACASFDQFKDFEDRGRKFKEWVWDLAREEDLDES